MRSNTNTNNGTISTNKKRKREYSDSIHHPQQKRKQIKKYITEKDLNIIEYFSGEGNLTETYKRHGNVESFDIDNGNKEDSFLLFHKHIYEKKKYNVIDLDGYGFPFKFFPDIFLLIDTGWMFITWPKLYVNYPQNYRKINHQCYLGIENPSIDNVTSSLKSWGMCHWREVEILNVIEFNRRIWRVCIKVEKISPNKFNKVYEREGLLKSINNQLAIFR